MAEIAVETRKLSLWYGTFQALFDVDFRVKKGMITSLIGPSGCGKSTLLRTINRVNERLGYVRTKGTVEVMGENILGEHVELARLRKEVEPVARRVASEQGLSVVMLKVPQILSFDAKVDITDKVLRKLGKP